MSEHIWRAEHKKRLLTIQEPVNDSAARESNTWRNSLLRGPDLGGFVTAPRLLACKTRTAKAPEAGNESITAATTERKSDHFSI